MLTITQIQGIIKSQETQWRRYEPMYREVQRFVSPYQGKFTVSGSDNTTKTITQPLFAVEPTALKALKVMAAGLQAGTTSRTRPWFSIQTDDPEFNRWPVMAEWIHKVKNKMYSAIDKSNYYSVTQNQYMELGAFGTAAMSIMPAKGGGITCHAFTAGEYMLSLDDEYNPNVFSRKFYMSVRQIVEKYGYDSASQEVKKLWDINGSDRDKQIEVVNCIMPNSDNDCSMVDSLNMEWSSYTWEYGKEKGGQNYCAKEFLNVSGYRERPVMTPRWWTNSDQVYGVSPSFDLMGRIKLLHKLDEKAVKAIDKMVDPPLSAPTSMRSRQMLSSVGMPNQVSFSNQGGDTIRPLYQINYDINAAEMKIDRVKREITDGYFNNIFITMMSMADDPTKTATEVVKLDEERLAQLGPVLERIHSEQIGPSIDRIFQLMMDSGELPEPPQEMYEKNLTIEYSSVVAEAMKSLNVNNQERFAGYVANLAQVNPDVLDVIDFDESVRDYASKMSIEPDQLKDQEQVDMQRQARAKAQQQAEQAESMPKIAQGTKALSESKLSDGTSALEAMI